MFVDRYYLCNRATEVVTTIGLLEWIVNSKENPGWKWYVINVNAAQAFQMAL
jgi:hypothetical protein